MALPRLVVVFGYRSLSAFEIFAGLSSVAEVIWLIDGNDPTAAANRRFLARTGTVVDAFGLEPTAPAEALREHHPEGIVTFYDSGMTHIAEIAAHLGLRFHTVTASRALEDKLEQRLALAAAGIESPLAMGLPAFDREALIALSATMRYPAVIKPRTASGSWRTVRVDSAPELIAAWDEMRESQGSVTGDAPEAFLVEEYLPDGPPLPAGFEGDYVSVETVAMDGELDHLAITGRFPIVSPFRETGYFIPATLDAFQHAEVIRAATAALQAVGFATGCAHTELKLTRDGWRVIEINGRIGGGVPDMLRIATGLELITLTARAALGRYESPAELKFSAVGYRFFYQPPVGRLRLTAIDGVKDVSAIPGVESVDLHHLPGTELDSRDGTRTYLLAVVGRATDHASVMAVDTAIKSAIRADYEDLESGSETSRSVELV